MSDPAMEALETLYREDGVRLGRALTFYCGDREVATDALAEAFARAIRGRERIRDPRAWVWRVAFRVAAADLKERRTTGERPPESSYEMPEPIVDLVKALKHLSPRQRQCLVLFHYCGYSSREVARLVGSTPVAVTVHLSVGRKRLRALMEDRDES